MYRPAISYLSLAEIYRDVDEEEWPTDDDLDEMRDDYDGREPDYESSA